MLSRAKMHLGDPFFLLGLLIYATHWFVQELGIPIKVGEFTLLLILLVSARSGVIAQQIPVAVSATYFCLLLGVWGVLADLNAMESAASLAKTAVRMPLYFILIIVFISLHDPRRPLQFVLGFFAGDILYFATMFPLTLLGFETGYVVSGGAYDDSVAIGSSVLVKWLVPNPLFVLSILLCFRHWLSSFQKTFWKIAFISTLAASLTVEIRTRLLAAVLWLILYLFLRILRRWSSLRVFTVALIFCITPLIPIIVAEFVTASDVYNSEFNSWSNIERIFMLNVVSDTIRGSPMFGTGSSSFWALYGPRFEEVFGFPAKVDSPHNLYAEVSISWGVPAGLFVLVLNALLSACAAQRNRDPVLISLALATIAANYAVQPLADVGRLSTTLLWFCAYCHIESGTAISEEQTYPSTTLALPTGGLRG